MSSDEQKSEINKAFVEKEIDEIYLGFFRTSQLINSTEDWKAFIRGIIKRVMGWKK